MKTFRIIKDFAVVLGFILILGAAEPLANLLFLGVLIP